MKKMNLMMVFLVVVMSFTIGQAFALPVHTGEIVYLDAVYNHYDNKNNGNYDVYLNSNSSFAYSAFCIQKETHFYNGTRYSVTIDDDVYGYKSNDSLAPAAPTDHVALVAEVKYLFWNFSLGTLTGYDGSAANVSALQDAIWAQQGYDLGDMSGNSFYSAAENWDGSGIADMHVSVMNLWSLDGDGVVSACPPVQSQLIAEVPEGGETPVPEPATLILLGSGLAGLAFYRRKKK